MQSDPRYAEGFYDAQDFVPLFDDADPTYAAGWRAYWACHEIVSNL